MRAAAVPQNCATAAAGCHKSNTPLTTLWSRVPYVRNRRILRLTQLGTAPTARTTTHAHRHQPLRPRRLRNTPRRPSRPRPRPPQHHRPGQRSPTHGRRQQRPLDLLQRRNLQLRRTTSRTTSSRAHLPQPLRHRSQPGSLPPLRTKLRLAIQRRLRLRPLGPAPQQLLLARDRLGVRPIYYTVRDGVLYFGFEVKALFQVPGIRAELNSLPCNSALACGIRWHRALPGRASKNCPQDIFWSPRAVGSLSRPLLGPQLPPSHPGDFTADSKTGGRPPLSMHGHCWWSRWLKFPRTISSYGVVGLGLVARAHFILGSLEYVMSTDCMACPQHRNRRLHGLWGRRWAPRWPLLPCRCW